MLWAWAPNLHLHQPCIGSECACEQDQAIQQWTRHEPGSVECERVVDRGLTGVEVDGLNTRPLQLEHGVGCPQSCRERVTHAVKTAARDRVELRQHKRQACSPREHPWGLDRL